MALQTPLRGYFLTLSVLVFVGLQTNPTNANADIQAWVCQGQPFTLACADIAPYLANAGFVINSLTIFAHTDVAVVSEDRPAECLGGTQSQCYRVVESLYDVGLDADYRYFVEWFQSVCNGKSNCSGVAPKWYELIGRNSNCPENGTNYFHKVLVHASCNVNVQVPTVALPAITSPKTPPAGSGTTTLGPISLLYHTAELSNLEKIILAACIGVAVVLLVCILVLLYCCDRYKKKMRKNSIHKRIGGPTADMDNIYNDIDDNPESWGAQNEGALREFTGAKPSEFIDHTLKTNMTQAQMYHSTQYLTAQSESGYATPTPTPPPDYDTAENLDLERRMAENLNQARLQSALEMASSKH